MSQEVPKKDYDKTKTKRQGSYLARLEQSGGKRIPIDFRKDEYVALNDLVANGFADSNADAVRKAVLQAREILLAKGS